MTTAAREAPQSVEELDEILSEPRPSTVEALRACPGDVLVLGAAGKMGPTLTRMAVRAARLADGARPRKVMAVSRFASDAARAEIERHGGETIRCDLRDQRAVEALPDAANVVFMAGQKFGTTQAPSHTWMMNVVVPAHCARRFAGSRIVAFSTGNVYPLVPAHGGGATEDMQPAPVGEYASSCLGRERVFEFWSESAGTRIAIVRLNYAIDLRYGVLTDLALRLVRGDAIPLGMGSVNVIWQGDANRIALELLRHAASPPCVVNVTGLETLSVRRLAHSLADRLGVTPRFDGTEATDALLSDSSRMRRLVGAPEMPLETMIDWVSGWVRSGSPLLDRPTHFETRDGSY